MIDHPLHINSNIHMFADDSTIYTSSHNVDEIQHSLQTNFRGITTWRKDNNDDNQHFKKIGPCQLLTNIVDIFIKQAVKITLNEQELQQVKQPTVFDVVVDENLQWRERIVFLTKALLRLVRTMHLLCH